jgi:phage tail sheath protein FI
MEPVVDIDNQRQDTLNADPEYGKSINSIRLFSGKGTVVWGARTLAGNDNEWRYVPVHRFFIMVKESLRKSTSWIVFEPNNSGTWLKISGMIEKYLTQKWQEGALAGITPNVAFYVKCGVGTSMTDQDILEGRIRIEVGLAMLRPAEFIVLRFSHLLKSVKAVADC